MRIVNILFNVVWFILFGLLGTICSLCAGILSCVTIIGIPFGLQHFKFIKLIAKPAGRTVNLNFGTHPFMNIFWLLFGGFSFVAGYFFLVLLFYVTIIGIPFGKQLMKLATFCVAPFGATID